MVTLTLAFFLALPGDVWSSSREQVVNLGPADCVVSESCWTEPTLGYILVNLAGQSLL